MPSVAEQLGQPWPAVPPVELDEDVVVAVVDPVLAPPLPDVVAAVVFEPAEPPGDVSSPPHAWAATNGSERMTTVQRSLRILRLLPLGVL
jgi:hypothetical protein